MGVAEEIVVLIKCSLKREDILGCIKEQVEFESEPKKKENDITKLSQTRWTVHATCWQRVIDNYEALINASLDTLFRQRKNGIRVER